MTKIAIVDVMQTKFESAKTHVNYAELVNGVVKKLFEKTGITHKNIDNIVSASSDFWDGRTISDIPIQDSVAAHNKPEAKVSSDGTFAVLYGMMRILSGQYRTALVVAHSKGSEGSPRLLENAAFDPVYQRHLGVDLVVASALQARAYMEKFSISEEELALVPVKALKNALKNPFAQRAGNISVSDVMKSRYKAEPLKELDLPPVSDGAVALLLADEKTAKKLTKKPVWLKGIGHNQDGYYLGDRELTESRALRLAAKKAYKMANIQNPLKEINVAEIYDGASYQELLWCEMLGFSEEGKGIELIKNGTTETGGSLPVNPSGGCLSAHAVIAAGPARVAECVLQLKQEAGEHQIEGVKTALAHGAWGPAGQSHCVIVMSSE